MNDAVANLLLRITGEDREAESTLDKFARKLKAVGAEEAKPQIVLDDKKATAELKAFKARIAELSRETATPNAQFDDAKARAEVTVFSDMLSRIDHRTVSADANLKIAKAMADAATFLAMLDKIDGKNVTPDVKMGITNQLKMLAMDAEGVASSFGDVEKSVGGGGAGGGGGGMLSSLGSAGSEMSTLTPVAYGLAAVIGGALVAGLAAIVASAAAAAAAIGALAIGFAGAAATAVPLLILGIKQFKDEANKAGTAANALKTQFTKTFSSLQAAAKPGINAIFRGFADVLKQIRPAIEGLKGPFTVLGKSIGSAFKAAGPGISQLITSFGQLMKAAAPLAGPVVQALVHLGQIFVNLARAAMPFVVALMKQIAQWLGAIASKTGNISAIRGIIASLIPHLQSWWNLIKAIGSVMLGFFKAAAPAGKQLVDFLAQGAQKLADWLNSAKGQDAVKKFFSDIVPLVKQVITFVAQLVPIFFMLVQAAAPALTIIFKILNQILSILAPIIQFLVPIIQFIGKIAAMAGGPILATITILNHFGAIWGMIKTAASVAWDAIKTGASAVGTALSAVWGAIKTAGTAVWGAIEAAAGAVWGAIKAGWAAVGSAVTAVFNAIKSVGTAVWGAISSAASAVWNAIKSAVSSLVGFFSGIWNSIKGVVIAALGAIVAPVVAVVAAIKLAFQGLVAFFGLLWSGIKAVAGVVWSAISTVVSGAVSVIKSVWSGITGFFSGLWGGIKSAATAAWGGIKSAITAYVGAVKTVWGGIKGFFGGLWNGIKSAASTAWNGVKNAASSAWHSITSLFAGGGINNEIKRIAQQTAAAIRGIGAAAGTAAGKLASSFSSGSSRAISALGRIPGAAKSAVSAAASAARGAVGSFQSAGAAMGNALASGIRAAAGAVVSAARSVAAAAAAVLPHSEPKDPQSPLRGLPDRGAAIVHMLAGGLRKAGPDLVVALDQALTALQTRIELSKGKMKKALESFLPKIQNLTNFQNAVMDLGDTLQAAARQGRDAFIDMRKQVQLAFLDGSALGQQLKALTQQQKTDQLNLDTTHAQENISDLTGQLTALQAELADPTANATPAKPPRSLTEIQQDITTTSRALRDAQAELKNLNTGAQVDALQTQYDEQVNIINAQADAAKAGFDRQANDYEDMLNKQLGALATQLSKGQISYATFVKNVNKILDPLGIDFNISNDTEIALRSGKSFIQAFIKGMKSQGGAVKDALRSMLVDLRAFLPGSEPKDRSSPLYGLKESGKALMTTFAEGVPHGATALQRAIADQLKPIATGLASPMMVPVGSPSSRSGAQSPAVQVGELHRHFILPPGPGGGYEPMYAARQLDQLMQNVGGL